MSGMLPDPKARCCLENKAERGAKIGVNKSPVRRLRSSTTFFKQDRYNYCSSLNNLLSDLDKSQRAERHFDL